MSLNYCCSDSLLLISYLYLFFIFFLNASEAIHFFIHHNNLIFDIGVRFVAFGSSCGEEFLLGGVDASVAFPIFLNFGFDSI